MKFVIVVTRVEKARFRYQIRPGFNQPASAISMRTVRDAAAARREAERIFGRLDWESPEKHAVMDTKVVNVARCYSGSRYLEGMTSI